MSISKIVSLQRKHSNPCRQGYMIYVASVFTLSLQIMQKGGCGCGGCGVGAGDGGGDSGGLLSIIKNK